MPGFPLLTLPLGLSWPLFDDIDQLFHEFSANPWLPAAKQLSQQRQSCCLDNDQQSFVASEAESERNEPLHSEEPSFEERSYHHRDFEQVGTDAHEQHRPRRQSADLRSPPYDVHKERDRRQHKLNHMGRHPSNQPPTTQRHDSRKINTERVPDEVAAEIPRHFAGHRRQNEEAHKQFVDINDPRPYNRERRTLQREVATPVDVYSVHVPGYKPRELHVKTEGRTLRIQGKQACGCQDSCAIREFERVFTLPEGIDTGNLQATLSRDGTLSVQSKFRQKLSRGNYADRDILVEGLDLVPIEDTAENTDNCVKKAGIKLAKINKRTGKRIPLTRQFDEVQPRTFENLDDGVTIEVVDDDM